MERRFKQEKAVANDGEYSKAFSEVADRGKTQMESEGVEKLVKNKFSKIKFCKLAFPRRHQKRNAENEGSL